MLLLLLLLLVIKIWVTSNGDTERASFQRGVKYKVKTQIDLWNCPPWLLAISNSALGHTIRDFGSQTIPIYWIWVIVPLHHTTEYIQLFEKDKTCFTIFHPGCVLEGGATLTVGSSDVYSAPSVASAINLYSCNTHLTESQIFNESRVLFPANMAKMAIYRTQ